MQRDLYRFDERIAEHAQSVCARELRGCMGDVHEAVCIGLAHRQADFVVDHRTVRYEELEIGVVPHTASVIARRKGARYKAKQDLGEQHTKPE